MRANTGAKFIDEFPDVEPGQLSYCVRPLGVFGRPEGPELLTKEVHAAAEERILHRSTSPNLPVKNYTAFFSLAGLPEMYSEVIQVRTATHASLALRRGVEHRTLGIASSDVFVASVFEGILVPVDTVGHDVITLSGIQLREFQGIRVLDSDTNETSNGFTIVEHGKTPRVTFSPERVGGLRGNNNSHAAMVVLGGRHSDLLPTANRALYHWEKEFFYDTLCKALPDTREE